MHRSRPRRLVLVGSRRRERMYQICQRECDTEFALPAQER